jgi:hypothetical protein
MTTSQTIGEATGGKPIMLHQLEAELVAVGVSVNGLGMVEDLVYTYGADGLPSDFEPNQQRAVQQAIADHVAMRDKTSAEYATEFQDPNTPPARKQEIRDIQSGLIPPEQVPM